MGYPALCPGVPETKNKKNKKNINEVDCHLLNLMDLKLKIHLRFDYAC